MQKNMSTGVPPTAAPARRGRIEASQALLSSEGIGSGAWLPDRLFRSVPLPGVAPTASAAQVVAQGLTASRPGPPPAQWPSPSPVA